MFCSAAIVARDCPVGSPLCPSRTIHFGRCSVVGVSLFTCQTCAAVIAGAQLARAHWPFLAVHLLCRRRFLGGQDHTEADAGTCGVRNASLVEKSPTSTNTSRRAQGSHVPVIDLTASGSDEDEEQQRKRARVAVTGAPLLVPVVCFVLYLAFGLLFGSFVLFQLDVSLLLSSPFIAEASLLAAVASPSAAATTTTASPPHPPHRSNVRLLK